MPLAPSPSGVPLVAGTAVFVAISVVLTLIGFLIGKRGKLFTSRDSGLFTFVSVGSVFLAWLMWACMWLMQWHPLVIPYSRPSHD